MSERYKQVKLYENFKFYPTSPIDILKGDIYIDNMTSKAVFQLKFINMQDKHIKAIYIQIIGSNDLGEKIENQEYTYLDLNVGNFKLKDKGSCGGHNGLRNIEACIHTQEYKRLKIGISNDKNRETKDYVLGRFSKEENVILNELFSDLVNVIDDYFSMDFLSLMNRYNRKNR